MGILDKISNLIFEEEPNNGKSGKAKNASGKKGSWTDIFFEDATEDSENKGKKKKFSDIFFEEVPEEDDGIKSTFVVGDDKTSILNDLSSQIERRESELINLAEFFKSVNPTDYPDSAPEYEAYLSLVKQLNAIKELSNSGTNSSSIASVGDYQLESSFRKFETDYKLHINAIQSLCYLSEIANLNDQLQNIFSSHFTEKTDEKINQIDEYISLISKKGSSFDKKYSGRLYKELIEAEYRMTIVRLMSELKNGRNPRKNPFASYPPQKKKTFETYLSRDLRETNSKYNKIADGEEKYKKYALIEPDFFDRLDADAEVISEQVNRFTIDDFLLTELLENGEGFESLKRFLAFKLNLNYIDSKTQEVDARFLDDAYRRTISGRSVTPKNVRTNSPKQSPSQRRTRKYPNYEDDL